MKELAQRLSQWRKLWGFSQRELARRADITNGTLSQIEQGNTSPSIQTVQKLAEAFGIDLQTLMFSEPYPPILVRSEGGAPLLPLAAGTAGIYSFDDKAATFHRVQILPHGVLEYADILSVSQSDPYAQGAGAGLPWLRVYVVSGDVSIAVVGRTVSLLAGDAACVPAERPFSLIAADQASEVLLLMPFSAVPSARHT